MSGWKCMTDWEIWQTVTRTTLSPVVMTNVFNKRLRGYHRLIYEVIWGQSLPALALFVHPLDLRLRLFLGYEHSRHAWLSRFCAGSLAGTNTHTHRQTHTHTHTHTHTDVLLHLLHGGLISTRVSAEPRRVPVLYTWALCCHLHCAVR